MSAASLHDSKQVESPACAASDDDGESFPEHFVCPITFDVMSDPVVAADGHTYERTALEHWLQTHDRSPKTNEHLFNKVMIPNHVMRSQIVEHMEARGFRRE